MTGKSNLELKVGIFAFIALVILTVAVFCINEITVFEPGYHIKVVFNFANGIEKGAEVRVAGLKVGEVKDVQLSYDQSKAQSKIVFLVYLDQGVQITRDSLAKINVLGFIGDTYLEIIPGRDYAHFLREGEILPGYDSLPAESLTEIAQKAADNFNAVLDSVKDVLGDPAKEDLKETIRNCREFSESVKVIAGRLERGEGRLGAWLKPKTKGKKPVTSNQKPE
ncbi:MAG: MlaD family protein [Candidatus Omnitrophota bacterium]